MEVVEMSVMVLSEEKFVQLKKYLMDSELTMNIEKIKDNVFNSWVVAIEEKYENLVTYFYKMNVLNYCNRYNENVEFIPINFNVVKVAIDKNEALDILKSLRYNTCDYFKTPELDGIIKQLENNAE